MFERIVSGGQTGADRAALDWAITHSIPHGGWCPQGRVAEDGNLDAKYELDEMESGRYRQRTKQNVSDSDGTLIFNLGELEGGTSQTVRFAEQLNKPYQLIQLENIIDEHELAETMNWLVLNKIKTLNIAGPRESKRPNIYNMVNTYLTALYSYIQQQPLKDLRLKKKVYTIYVDNGEWAWVKDADDETMYVGSCVSSGYKWYGDHHVSKQLLDFTQAWLDTFTPVAVDSGNINTFNWKAFNQQGLAVAQRLKSELGDQADIRYVKAGEDPTRVQDEGFEVLNDGTVLPKKLLWWCPVETY